MCQPNIKDSIITRYAETIEANRKRRQLAGEYSADEPEPLIFDDCEDESQLDVPWQYTNLISLPCIADIFGDDFNSVYKLLMAHPCTPVVYNFDDGRQDVYYREADIIRVIEVLTTLAKSNFVNTLRPQFRFVKDDEPVFSGKDMMNILDIKEERLRKFRDEGYLGYTKYAGSDKIWYTKQNLMDFLNNPVAVHKPWK